MPRKYKTDLVKEEAPNVETKIIMDPKKEDPIIEKEIKPTDDLIVGDKIENITEFKEMLFDPSPNNKKTIVVKRTIPKKQTPFELAQIKANLTVRPLSSSYRGSRTKKSSSTRCGFSFKIGKGIY